MFKKKENKRNDWKINRTVQDTIPYHKVHEKEDLIETEEKEFSRAYLLDDLNFSTSKREDQELMHGNYQNLLNSFPVNVRVQITVINKSIDKNVFKKDVLMEYVKDGLDEYREEYNQMLVNKMEEGKNNLIHQRFLVASTTAENAKEAFAIFRQVDSVVSTGVKKIGGLSAAKSTPLSAPEYLEVLHDIYNPKLAGQFNQIRNIDGERVKGFSFGTMVQNGLTTKDLIAPDSFEFKANHFKVGETYGRVYYINKLPSSISPRVLSELAANEVSQIISLTYTQMGQDVAVKTVERHITAINAERIEKQKKGSRAGYDGDLIGHSLVDEVESSKRFLSDMSSRNQKLFLLTGTMIIFADSEEELDKFSGVLNNIARRFLIEIKPLRFQQEQGLSQTLPLARKDVFVERTMNTESSAAFMPYDTQEFSHENGRYYGVNATSNNLVIYDRKTAANQNGFILGVSGSGKSFIAKAEMVNVMLDTEDDIVVIDPEAEYGALAERLGGAVVPISLGSGNHINPLDMADDYGDGRDPIPEKSDFITQIVETMVGDKYSGLSSVEKSIIDRAVKSIYAPYFEKLELFDKKSVSSDDYNTYRRSITPTLSDLRNELNSSGEMEGKRLALSIEQYTEGSFNLFAKKTNVSNNDRFVVYDINSIGRTIKPLAMMIIMDAIWNRILENRDKGKNTWIYIDEIYLMFDSEESTLLLQAMWKRARKYGGINTGITQNVEDLLQSSAASTMLSNSEFVIMMNQSTLDRENLIGLLNISETQSSYITAAEPGQGLLYTGKAIVPFINKFPKDTELYKVMTSNNEEVAQYKAEELARLESKKNKVLSRDIGGE